MRNIFKNVHHVGRNFSRNVILVCLHSDRSSLSTGLWSSGDLAIFFPKQRACSQAMIDQKQRPVKAQVTFSTHYTLYKF